MLTTRRDLLKYGAAASSLAGAAQGAAARAQSASASPGERSSDTQVSAGMIDWALGLTYEALPAAAIHAAKRYIIDALGCAYQGWTIQKGRLSAALVINQGGVKQATILGHKTKRPIAGAAYANAELMNALDYDSIPHTPPVTLPAILAMAEARGASGKDLILATIIGHELAARLSAASSQMISALLETGTTPDVFGINTEAALATSIAVAKLAGLSRSETAHAMGLAGYYTPPQASHNWETLSTKTNVKYTPVGLICQNAVQAVQLAKSGFTSNAAILDGEAAFPKFYGWPAWTPERATTDLGERWRIEEVDFKPYAACRFIHSQIDCMERLQAKHALAPEEIASINTLGVPFTAHPDPMNVTTPEDAQFSTPYNIAVAACRIPIDAKAQSPAVMDNPTVRDVMEKISWGVHPQSQATREKDLRSYIAKVTVTTTDGRVLTEETLYPRGAWSQPDVALPDAFLTTKFLKNTTETLGERRARLLCDKLWSLENAVVSDLEI